MTDSDEMNKPSNEGGEKWSSRGEAQGERRSFGDRDSRPPRRDFARPRRDFGGDRGGERRSFGDRDGRPPRREFGDRPPRREFGDRPPRRDFGDRPPRREFGDDRGPSRSFGDRDSRPPRRDFDGPRRDFSGDRGGERRSFGDRDSRPPRREFGDRPPRRDFGDRPPRREFGGDRGGERRSFGDRDNRPPRRDFEDRPRRPKFDREGGRQEREESGFEGDRIAKVIARAGLCSRRDAEMWIEEGRIELNGEVLTSPARNVTAKDEIKVDGKPLEGRERTRLWLFHKKPGFMTTNHDPEGRPTIFDILPEDLPRVVTVGRLDMNTEGLLLLTNDGGLARVLELPSTGWLRKYRVRANGEIDQETLDTIKDGVTIDDVEYAGVEATLDRTQGANVWLTVGLREGKNREVKRILEHFGLQVNRLIRISYGPFQLGELPEGAIAEIPLRVLLDQLGPVLAAEAGIDKDSPVSATIVTHDMDRMRQKSRPPRDFDNGPSRDRPSPGSRKHVSRVREEGDRDRAFGPRKRTFREDGQDRHGRPVTFERRFEAGDRDGDRDRRPSRSFGDRDRNGGGGGGRFARDRDDRGGRGGNGGGFSKPWERDGESRDRPSFGRDRDDRGGNRGGDRSNRGGFGKPRFGGGGGGSRFGGGGGRSFRPREG